MIKLHVMHGEAFVWNVDDVYTLRTKHRIMGTMVGCLPRLPKQNRCLGLPMQLMREEATLLVEKGFACFIERLERTAIDADKQGFVEFRLKSYEDQVNLCKIERKETIKAQANKIIQGKIKKYSALNIVSPSLTPENLLQQEFDKIETIPPSQAMIQIFTESPWTTKSVKAIWQYPVTENEKLRYMTFKDFWDIGYYVTSGYKFGGDFLIYSGDPFCNHADFIVVCKPFKSELNWFDIVIEGRIGTSVKKDILISSLDDNGKINHSLLKWKSVR